MRSLDYNINTVEELQFERQVYGSFNTTYLHYVLVFHRVKICCCWLFCRYYIIYIIDTDIDIDMKSATYWMLFPFYLHPFNTFKTTKNIFFGLLMFNYSFSFAELSPLETSPSEEPKYTYEWKWKNLNMMSGIHLNYLIYNVCIVSFILQNMTSVITFELVMQF